jgi:hypothetical protein
MRRHLIRGNNINNQGQSSISLDIVHPEPNNVTLTPIIKCHSTLTPIIAILIYVVLTDSNWQIRFMEKITMIKNRILRIRLLLQSHYAKRTRNHDL